MMSEYEISKSFVKWLREEHPNILFCATVGGIHSTVQQKAKMRAAGYQRGIPDIMIYEPSHDGAYCGLALELKTAKGRLTKEQQQWIYDLQARGWQADAPTSLEQCKALAMKYLYNK